MEPYEPDSNAPMAYLLGGAGLLAISVVLVLSAMLADMQPTGKLLVMGYWMLGALSISWAVRRFFQLSERVVALLVIVIGWCLLLPFVFMLNTLVLKS